MKLVTGKDAVGTLSGPGTLGIERCTAARTGEGGVNGGGGDGGAVCGATVEDKRSAVVQTLVDVFSWGMGGEAATRAGAAAAAAAKGERDAGSSPTGVYFVGGVCCFCGVAGGRGAWRGARVFWFDACGTWGVDFTIRCCLAFMLRSPNGSAL